MQYNLKSKKLIALPTRPKVSETTFKTYNCFHQFELNSVNWKGSFCQNMPRNHNILNNVTIILFFHFQRVVRRRSPTRSRQRAWSTPSVGHAGKASSQHAGVASRHAHPTSLETGCGEDAETTSTTASVSPGSSSMPVRWRRTLSVEASPMIGWRWTCITMKLVERYRIPSFHSRSSLPSLP